MSQTERVISPLFLTDKTAEDRTPSWQWFSLNITHWHLLLLTRNVFLVKLSPLWKGCYFSLKLVFILISHCFITVSLKPELFLFFLLGRCGLLRPEDLCSLNSKDSQPLFLQTHLPRSVHSLLLKDPSTWPVGVRCRSSLGLSRCSESLSCLASLAVCAGRGRPQHVLPVSSALFSGI